VEPSGSVILVSAGSVTGSCDMVGMLPDAGAGHFGAARYRCLNGRSADALICVTNGSLRVVQR
jgi:hypothetical protein